MWIGIGGKEKEQVRVGEEREGRERKGGNKGVRKRGEGGGRRDTTYSFLDQVLLGRRLLHELMEVHLCVSGLL